MYSQTILYEEVIKGTSKGLVNKETERNLKQIQTTRHLQITLPVHGGGEAEGKWIDGTLANEVVEAII